MGLLSVSFFMLFKDLFSGREFGKSSLKIITFISKYSFGVYLVHAALIDALSNIFGINCFSFNTVFSVPLLGIAVFAVSLLIIYLVGKIPVLNKYIM
jgi:surface polysaccharide O-acyltransferase-like enzyme